MSTPIVQANYEQLEQIAGRFGQAAEGCAGLERRVRGTYESLADGGWLGRGAASFTAEMEGVLFPGLQRLMAALEAAREVTLELRARLLAAEHEAAAPFHGSGGAAGATGVEGVHRPTAGAGDNPLGVLGLAAAKMSWQLFKDRNAWNGLFKGLRFVQDADGLWRVFGSHAAKTAAGLPKNLTIFGEAAIKRNLSHFSVAGNLKNVAVGQGPFAERASQLMRSVTTTAPLTPAAGFLSRFKGAAGLSSAITAAQNVYEFGWGEQKGTGLMSRQFVTATTADLSAGLGIVGVSTLVGTMIPVPGVGTAAGFAVGVGLQYAYDQWGKEAWRDAVDSVGQHVQSAAGTAYNQVSRFGSEVSHGAHDAIGVISRGAGRVSGALSGAASTFGGALKGIGLF